MNLSEEERARVIRVLQELAEGLSSLEDIGPSMSIFGSARTPAEDPEYEAAQRLAGRLAAEGITIVTGGGPGIMEAANQGASDEPGRSVGLNIELPREQRANPYLDIELHFHYFFTRKFLLIHRSLGFAIFPGGFGTVDELFELLTLLQTGKMAPVPVVLIGKDYWQGLHQWLVQATLANGYINESDMEWLHLAENEEEAAQILLSSLQPRS